MTYDLFADQSEPSTAGKKIEMPDADVYFYPVLFSYNEAQDLFDDIKNFLANMSTLFRIIREGTIVIFIENKNYGQTEKLLEKMQNNAENENSFQF